MLRLLGGHGNGCILLLPASAAAKHRSSMADEAAQADVRYTPDGMICFTVGVSLALALGAPYLAALSHDSVGFRHQSL